MATNPGIISQRLIAAGVSKTALHVVYAPPRSTAGEQRVCFSVNALECITTVVSTLRLRKMATNLHATFDTSGMQGNVNLVVPPRGTVVLGASAPVSVITVGQGNPSLYDFTTLEDAFAEAAVRFPTQPDKAIRGKILIFPGTYTTNPLSLSDTSVCIESAPGCDPSAVKITLNPAYTESASVFIDLSNGSFVLKNLLITTELFAGLQFERTLSITSDTSTSPDPRGQVTLKNLIVYTDNVSINGVYVTKAENVAVEDVLVFNNNSSIIVVECNLKVEDCTYSILTRVISTQYGSSPSTADVGICAASRSTNNTVRAITLTGCRSHDSTLGFKLEGGHRTEICLSDSSGSRNAEQDLNITYSITPPTVGTWTPGFISVNACEFSSDVSDQVSISADPGAVVSSTVTSCLLTRQTSPIFATSNVIGSIMSAIGGNERSGVVTRSYGSFVTTDDATLPASAFLSGGDTLVPDWVLQSNSPFACFNDITDAATQSRLISGSVTGARLFGGYDYVFIGFRNANIHMIVYENQVADSSTEVAMYLGDTAVTPISYFALNTANSQSNGHFMFRTTNQTMATQNRSSASGGVVGGRSAQSWIILRKVAGGSDARVIGLRGITSCVYSKTSRKQSYLGQTTRTLRLQTIPVDTDGSSGTQITGYYGSLSRISLASNSLASGDFISFSVVSPPGLDLTSQFVARLLVSGSSTFNFTARITVAVVSRDDVITTAPQAPLPGQRLATSTVSGSAVLDTVSLFTSTLATAVFSDAEDVVALFVTVERTDANAADLYVWNLALGCQVFQ